MMPSHLIPEYISPSLAPYIRVRREWRERG